ncbi:MAG: uracil-DNA glycosylase [Chitinivibrionales bacterium]|nr:uracil-DNA glycosylase [Chitinivibrionales bacterium]MBD3396434.1 uracil-DNA glycosylase [Chitinivibrionales bacterium]
MKQCKWYLVCPMKYYHEKGVLDGIWIKKYCRGNWYACVRYAMEERGEPHPDWLLPNGSLDENLRAK